MENRTRSDVTAMATVAMATAARRWIRACHSPACRFPPVRSRLRNGGRTHCCCTAVEATPKTTWIYLNMLTCGDIPLPTLSNSPLVLAFSPPENFALLSSTPVATSDEIM